jgi:hypothetical protein
MNSRVREPIHMRFRVFIMTFGLYLGLVPVARAQDTSPTQTTPVDRLAVDVATQACGVEAESIRAALRSELTISLTADAAARMMVECDADLLRVTYTNGAQPVIKREATLPRLTTDRLRLITYLATNLVRDESADVLAGLLRLGAAAPIVSGDSKLEPTTKPHVTHPRLPRSTSVPAATFAATAERRAQPTTYTPVSIGFVPPLSVDRLAGTHTRIGVGLHLLVGVSDSATIVSASGLVDSKRDDVTGVQIAGLVAHAARIEGGVQIAGLVAHAQTAVDGAQLGGLAAIGHDVYGVQLGGIMTVATGQLHGLQLSGIASIARNLRGVQLAGVANVGGDVKGVQLAGIVNVGGDVKGMQLSVVNIARRMRGVQLGLLNISETSDDAFPIGLLNFARDGNVTVDTWAESSQLAALALRHGTRRVHNIWAVAWAPDHPNILVGAGLGVHVPMQAGTHRLGVDIEAMGWLTDMWHGKPGSLEQLRATIAIPIGQVEIITGAAINVGIDRIETANVGFHPVVTKRFTFDSGLHVVMWPTVFAGLRLHLR